MNKTAATDSRESVPELKITRKERDAAMNFLKFIYDEWREFEKRGIMKVDKTISNNEESINAN